METIDRIYCINLDSRPDRWIQMQEYFNYFNVMDKVTRFSAKTGAQMDEDGLVMHPPGNHHGPGQKGCAYSHYAVWRDCLHQGYSRVLILEDDCIFSRDWINILSNKLSTIDQEDPSWHAIFLNFSNELPIHHEWSLIQHQHLTGGYILSRTGLEVMDRVFRRDYLWPADEMTWWLQDQNHCYGYYPWLIIQRGTDSDIQTSGHCQADHDKVVRLTSVFSNFYHH